MGRGMSMANHVFPILILIATLGSSASYGAQSLCTSGACPAVNPPVQTGPSSSNISFDWQKNWGTIHMNSFSDGVLDPGSPVDSNGQVPCYSQYTTTVSPLSVNAAQFPILTNPYNENFCSQMVDKVYLGGTTTNKVQPAATTTLNFDPTQGTIDNGIKYDIKNSLLNCMSKLVPNWAYNHADESYTTGYVCRYGSQTAPYLDEPISAQDAWLHPSLRTMFYAPVWDPRSNDARTETVGFHGCQQQISNNCGNPNIPADLNGSNQSNDSQSGIQDIHECIADKALPTSIEPGPGPVSPITHVFSASELGDLGLASGSSLPAYFYEYEKYDSGSLGPKSATKPSQPSYSGAGVYAPLNYITNTASNTCPVGLPMLGLAGPYTSSQCAATANPPSSQATCATPLDASGNCSSCSVQNYTSDPFLCPPSVTYQTITSHRPALASAASPPDKSVIVPNSKVYLVSSLGYQICDTAKLGACSGTAVYPSNDYTMLSHLKSFTFTDTDSNEDKSTFVVVDPSDFFDLWLYTSPGHGATPPAAVTASGKAGKYDPSQGGIYSSAYAQFDSSNLVEVPDSCPIQGLAQGYSGICDPTGQAGCNLPIYGVGTPGQAANPTVFTDASGATYSYSQNPLVWSGYVKSWAVISVADYLTNTKGRVDANGNSLYLSDSTIINSNPVVMVTRASQYCQPVEMTSTITTAGNQTPHLNTVQDMPCIQYLQFQKFSQSGTGWAFVDMFAPDIKPPNLPATELVTMHLYNIDKNGVPITTQCVPGGSAKNSYGAACQQASYVTATDFDTTKKVALNNAVYSDDSLNLKNVPAVTVVPPVVSNTKAQMPGVYLNSTATSAGTPDSGTGIKLTQGLMQFVRMPAALTVNDTQASCVVISSPVVTAELAQAVPGAGQMLFIPTNTQYEFQSFVTAASTRSAQVVGAGTVAGVNGVTVRSCTGNYMSNSQVVSMFPSLQAANYIPPATPTAPVATKTWLGTLQCSALTSRPSCDQAQLISGERYCMLEDGILGDGSSCASATDPDASITAQFQTSVAGESIVQMDDPSYFEAYCYASSSECPAAATSGGHVFCLAPETKITMADGSKKSIRKVKAGEKVMAFDAKASRNFKLKTSSVKATAVTKNQKILRINGLGITPLHKVVLANGRAVMAKDVKVGDQILNANGSITTVSTVEDNLKPITVYNLVLESGSDGYIANDMRVLSYPILKGMPITEVGRGRLSH
jgi:hypothetical protein